MISSLFILNSSGDVIIEKHWRGLVNRTVVDYFLKEINQSIRDGKEINPVMLTPKHCLIHINRDGLYLLSIVQAESPALLILEFLHRVIDIFQEYFGPVHEVSIKDNFVTVYQLLEEMMDNGIPFTTEPNILKEMITPPNLINKVVNSVTGTGLVNDVLPDGSMSNVRWRKMGVKYGTNEIYFDITEEMDCIVEPNGLLASSEVSGEIMTNCRLTGMPDLTLAFNNPRMLDDVSFHPCVRFNRWEHGRVISFIPPDGSFKLMNYRVKGNLQLPLYAKPTFRWTETSGHLHLMCGQKNTMEKTVDAVVVTIPFSKVVLSTSFTTNTGHIQFDEVSKICRWIIGRLPKEKTPILEGNISLNTGAPKPEMNPVLSVDFSMTQFAASGIKVDSLACTEKYKPYKGVRCVTKAGKIQIRS